MYKKISIYIFFLLLTINISGQNASRYFHLKVRYLTIEEGLSNNKVNSICKDNFGFMWFATSEGLNRFDGNSIVVYKYNNRDSTTISNNLIKKIFIDCCGNMWIGTDNGIDIYNPGKNNFSHLKCINKNIRFKVVRTIEQEQDSTIWFGTLSGLFYKKPGELHAHDFAAKNHGIRLSDIKTICSDNHHNLWIGTIGNGLYIKKNKETGCHPVQQIKDIDIESIHEDKQGKIWIGTRTNLYVFNYEDSGFTAIDFFKNIKVKDIAEGNDGRLWIGTYTGLYLKEKNSDVFDLYANTEHKLSVLNYNSINDIYFDNNDIMWMGTYAGGVNYIDFHQLGFRQYKSKENNNRFLNDDLIFSITGDKSGNLWIGTERGGLNMYNRRTGHFTYYKARPNNPDSLVNNNIKALEFDNNMNLWIGTMDGLNCYEITNKRFKRFVHQPDNPNSIINNRVYALCFDKQNNLWVGTRFGVELLPAGKNRFIHFPNKEGSKHGLGEIQVQSMLYDSNGNLWIGSPLNGIYKYLPKDSTFVLYSKKISDIHIFSLFEDSKQKIWAGTNSGLFCIDNENDTIYHYSNNNELPSNTIYGIAEDSNGNLWISTTNGIIKFIEAIHLPDEPQFDCFNKNNGLEITQFVHNSYYKSKTGEIFFGGINGIIFFKPEEIKQYPHKPVIQFTGLRIFNKPVDIGQEIMDKIVLPRAIHIIDTLELSYRHNVFSLEFVTLRYSRHKNLTYKYMLEGFDNEWNITSADKSFATYTNLPGGEYVFKVMLTNKGLSGEKPKSLRIIINPPFWKRLWFELLITFSLISAILAIYYTRIYAFKNRQEILEAEVNKRTSDLKKANIEQEIQKQEIQQQSEEIASQHEEIILKNKKLKETYKKISILNNFGQQLTTLLDSEAIVLTIYDYVKELLDVSVFGIGIYNKKINRIIFSVFIEDGKPTPQFSSSLNDTNSCASYCFNNQETIFSNDFKNEYKNYVNEIYKLYFKVPESVIFLPLSIKQRKTGVLLIHSYKKNAYSDNDLQTLQTLASYIAIALDNAYAYKIVNNQRICLQNQQTHLEQQVKERTKDLEEAKIKAEESDKLKSSFLANISHEIRTPLNAIVGFTDLLFNYKNVNISKEEIWPIIESNSASLIKLIDDIIDFSEIEAGHIKLNKSDININALLYDIYDTHNLKHNGRKNLPDIKFLCKPESDISPVIRTDLIRLTQIINNLIDNAFKFTKKGLVEFGYRDKSGLIEFYVKDSGIGIDKKYHEAIFKRFRKIEEDNSEIFRGTGIGLSISKNLVNKLGGKIWLTSETGKGAEFIFSIPKEKGAVDTKIIHKKKKIAGYKEHNWQQNNILIIEDEISNYKVLEIMLRPTGINILWAKDGNEAVGIFKRNNIKIATVLMDIKLPIKDGFETAREIKTINSGVPIIAQTAYAQPEEEYKIRKSGFDDYLSKPINREELIQTISSYLSNS